MHCRNTLKREQIVHIGEQTFLHLATVPGVENDLHFLSDVENNSCLGVKAQFLVVLDLCLRCCEHYEIRLAEVCQFLLCRTDEHIAYKVCLPGNLHNEPYLDSGVGVCSAESVNYIKLLVGKLFACNFLEFFPSLLAARLVVVLVLV